MIRSVIFILVTAWLATAGAGVAAPLAAYGHLPNVERAQISPDGELLAIASSDGIERSIVIRKTADDAQVLTVPLGDAKLRAISWAGSRHLVATFSETATPAAMMGRRREHMSATLIDVTSGRSQRLLRNQPQALSVIVREPEVRTVGGSPSIFLIGLRLLDSRSVLSLFRHDVATGRTTLAAAGESGVDDWEVGPGGEPLAKSLYDQASGRWTLRMRGPDGWRPVLSQVMPLGSPRLMGLGRTADSVVIQTPSPTSGGEPILREHRANGDQADLDIQFTEAVRDPASQLLIGGYQLIGDENRHVFADPAAEAVWRAVQRAYPKQGLRLASWSNDKQKVVARSDDPDSGPEYALIDLGSGAPRPLGAVYARLSPDDISPVRRFSYKAADGLTISSYLTLPRGRAPANLPLIVLPHGGPAIRDVPGFDWWSQALASRGYAVLRPNYRGSTGYGQGFLEAGFGEWGRKMQTDLSDGVSDLARLGFIDPNRACVVGSSYGGYAALAGVTLQHGLYRCAVSVNGPADLQRMFERTRGLSGQHASLRFWSRFMGIDPEHEEDLAEISPTAQAAHASAPILLIHGKDDTVVPHEQARLMADALNRAGKRVELVSLDGEDHWLSHGDTRLRMLESMVAFLERENPPR